MTRVGLVGSGTMAGVYADRLAGLDAEVVAVASPNTAGAFVAEHAPGATAYADAAAMYDAEPLDAVGVCSPTHLHREHVEAAVERGLDVVCEKPLARTMAGADAIVEAVEGSDVTFMTAHVVRFFPEYATARERVEAGDVGTPGVVRAKRSVAYGGDPGWFADEEKSGGVLLDVAIHDLDYLRWVVGPVERVFARLTRWGGGDHKSALATLRFASGAVGHVEADWLRMPDQPFETRFEIAGDGGLIEFDARDATGYEAWTREGHRAPTDPFDLVLAEDGYHRQLRQFLDCREGGGEPTVGAEAGRASVRVALAAIESAESGAPVAVDAVE
ncbi:MAG: Gfo/Idh/MocA family protein [Halobacteriaceae archaeon]